MDSFNPAFPSGDTGVHSEGAAAGEVLIRFFDRDDYDLDLDSPFLPGVIRSFSTISDAVDECLLRRSTLHTRHAVDAGEAMGYLVGDYVLKMGCRKIK